MYFDSLTLHSVVAQLNETVVGGQILSVIQTSQFEFALRISAREKLYNLLFSIHPVYARVHLTETYPRKEKRWHFADFLQTHTGKGKILLIEQEDFDRIIRIRIAPHEEIMEPVPRILIGEFMGKHSNVILLEKDKILESMKHIDENMSRYRVVLPGAKYIPPPTSQTLDLFSIDEETLIRILSSGDMPVWKKLLQNIQGISPLLAREIVARATDPSPEPIVKALMQIRDDILSAKYSPNVVINSQSEVVAVSPINLHQFSSSDLLLKNLQFSDISNALEYFYQHLIIKESLEAEKNAILQSLKKKYQDLNEKQDLLNQQLTEAENADTMKLKGDLLIANLNNIKRGQKEAVFPLYDPDAGKISIQLDEKLSPSDNAQKYFERYKKAKKSKDFLIKLISKNQIGLKYIQEIISEIEKLEDLNDIAGMRINLEQKGIIKGKTTGARKSRDETPLFRRFRSSDDFQIYLGRNDKENDLLIREVSSKNDMWLHAKQIEGSHVIIRNPEKRPDIPRRTLLEAAIIAASFSKAKHSTFVPVDYTWVKYVSKPRGAKPGFVIYTHEKTLFVSPSDFDSRNFRKV